MRTEYYCKKCDIFFYEEEKLPNINRVHYQCGGAARIVIHFTKADLEEGGDLD